SRRFCAQSDHCSDICEDTCFLRLVCSGEHRAVATHDWLFTSRRRCRRAHLTPFISDWRVRGSNISPQRDFPCTPIGFRLKVLRASVPVGCTPDTNRRTVDNTPHPRLCGDPPSSPC